MNDLVKSQDRIAIAILIERCNDLQLQRDEERLASMQYQTERDDSRRIAFSYLQRLKAAGAAAPDELPPWAFDPKTNQEAE
ncbi:MAG: hypothetical protein IJU32_09695 [Pyramidobacter sp.]|nr:hypothetical protein [Pyramidobacter sp.]